MRRNGLGMAVLIASLLLAYPVVAGAATWSWGYNYLGNSTASGSCPSPPMPTIGWTCSGWNYWASNFIDKQAGGSICYGWTNSSVASCWAFSGNVLWSTTPADAGMGGYLKSMVYYNSGAASYLTTSART